jgi:hypothetical protein
MAKAARKTEHAVPAMDYAEHDRTYGNFIWLTKWTVAANVALLIAMAFGFFGGFGLFGGTLVFLLLLLASWYLI